MSASSGSGAAAPYSSMPAGCQSCAVISPSLPRLDTQAEPLSCWPPQTRYGHALSVPTLYIAAVGWLYQELQVLPSLTVTIAPWSEVTSRIEGLFGLIQVCW